MLRVNKFKHTVYWLVLFCAVLLLNSCEADSLTSTPSSNVEENGFAIYLTKDDIQPSKIESIDDVVVADEPLISLDGIISYDAQTHEILLTDDVYTRIIKLEVSVFGKSFVVCVKESPQYFGAFWTPISSASFDGIIIMKPLSQEGPKTIKIEFCYPVESYNQSDDPRNNQEIFEILDNAGKLINKPLSNP